MIWGIVNIMASSMATNIMQMDFMTNQRKKRLQDVNDYYDSITNDTEESVEKNINNWNNQEDK